MRGCTEKTGTSQFDLNGEFFYRCPYKLIDADCLVWLQLYFHYKNGHLPVAGGILNQTQRFIEIMQIIQTEQTQHGSEKAKTRS